MKFLIEPVWPRGPTIKTRTKREAFKIRKDLYKKGYDDVCILKKSTNGTYYCDCQNFKQK